MHVRLTRRSGLLAGAAAATGLALIVAAPGGGGLSAVPASGSTPQYKGYLERFAPVAGSPSKESEEIRTSRESVAQARLAPYGSVAAGQLSSSLGAFTSLPSTAAAWQEVTTLPYDEDDPDYRDPLYSNSSGGAGLSAGRVTGLASGNGVVFAGGANGGVFRRAVSGGAWTPISDKVLSLSTGDLNYDAKTDTLWLATGEANTGGTSYTGSGVYKLPAASQAASVFTQASRVGGTELESRGINQLKVGGGFAYAATTRGLWRHTLADTSSPWVNVLMPNPADDSDITKPYNNIVNDVAIDPKTGAVLANAAWRSGAAYNGFYLSSTGAAGTFAATNPGGAINPKSIGNTEFAYAADGSRLYAVIESPTLLATGRQSGNSVLYGVFASRSGSVEGPWSQIADYRKLGNSGSALKPDNAGKGYGPGVQAWYNNFIEVDPSNPEHVYLGLEEVFETTNGGSGWTTPGPYWNFGFPCWDISEAKNTCPDTTHSDQHSIAIADGRVFVGNDGGVKSRPLDPAKSTEDALGHATDWKAESVGLGTLQYYSVGVGADPKGGYAVSGGLQDNGGSLIRGGASTMVSPFGGDGGDIVVDPKNGCRILDEYTNLTLWMTTTCGQTDGSTSAVFDVSVPDVNARFTAPFRAVRGSKNVGKAGAAPTIATERWVAGGNSVWSQARAFDYTPAEATADPARGWTPLTSLGTTSEMTVGLDAIANPKTPQDPKTDVVYAAWCGTANCNSAGFTRGVRTNAGGAWGELDMTGLPNRYPNAVTIDEADSSGKTFYLAFNGYNRRFIEGPGAQQDHLFKGVVTGPTRADGTVPVTWTNLSKGLPDVPATDVVRVGNTLVLGTDYGVLSRPVADGGTWSRVGGNLPLTTVFDLSVAPDGNVYAATHGRGIWKVPTSATS
jgi:hypothetical protein